MIVKMSVGEKHETNRKAAFESSKFNPHQSKFGLFSQPGFIATSEDTYARPLKNHRDKDGKVMLAPKNFIVTGPLSKTQGPFSTPVYQCDLYQDPPRVYQIEKERAMLMYKSNGSAWKHSGVKKEKLVEYEYKADPIAPTPCHKEPDGSVKTGPKGFFAAPAKRGYSTPGITIGKVPEHINDPYENYEDWLRQEKKKMIAKRLCGQFVTTSFGKKCFTENKELYKTVGSGKGFKSYEYDGVKHPKPFMNTNPIGFTIDKYPDYLANQLVEKKSPKRIEIPWKHSGHLGSVPCRAMSKLID